MVLSSVQFGPLLFFGQISVNAVAGWFWHRPCPTVWRPGLVVVRDGTAIVPPDAL